MKDLTFQNAVTGLVSVGICAAQAQSNALTALLDQQGGTNNGYGEYQRLALPGRRCVVMAWPGNIGGRGGPGQPGWVYRRPGRLPHAWRTPAASAEAQRRQLTERRSGKVSLLEQGC